MRVLLVEDDEPKRRQIVDLFSSNEKITLTCAASLNEAVKHVDEQSFEKIILDMSLPTLNSGNRANASGQQQDLGGRQFLTYLWELSINTEVFLVTQLNSFKSENGKIISLQQLDKMLQKEFPGIYKGHSYFHHSTDDWAEKLKNFISP
ncbi:MULTISPECIES: response regulator [unclassified Acidovorax]|uniref:response regulator n=1 Tax=unclassified Acidovorax TaxID=2684926 RepID=UPI0009E7739C|nr:MULTISPECIES: response regulator [unclassified Acidovorax]